MTTKRNRLDEYKKYLLNRSTTSPQVIEYLENLAVSDDEALKYTFHKIMILGWNTSDIQLFETLSNYFVSSVIPINCTKQSDMYTFYTSNLNMILKIVKLDFMFPFARSMYNVDILFNDKSSLDFFENAISIEDVVNGVVYRRFTENCELDLSDFSNDGEFIDKRITFYKLSLLSNFKILMLRIGKGTKILNLSKNNLSVAPVEVLNFFIKGDLTAINLSDNNIATLNDLFRVTSKIEKLWLEGNPLCEELDPVTYIKNVTVKFPRLIELDGMKLNQQGMMFPVFRNYVSSLDRRTKMLVEKFVMLYFSAFDSVANRKKVESFYDDDAKLTITANFTDAQAKLSPHYIRYARKWSSNCNDHLFNKKVYRKPLCLTFAEFPTTVHDLSTFNIDVLIHDKTSLLLIIEGVFKEKSTKSMPDIVYHFRRTFLFNVNIINDTSIYHISNELFYVTCATEEQIASSFKNPIRNMNTLALLNPDPEDSDAICKAFQHLTQLKKTEAELRLKYYDWDIKEALKKFVVDLKKNFISPDCFIDDDDFSDTSSLLDEID